MRTRCTLALWNVSRPPEIPVYNLGQLEMNPVTFGEIETLGYEVGLKYPFSVMLWYPSATMQDNKYVFKVLTFIMQWIPAYLIDGILFVLGYKTL